MAYKEFTEMSVWQKSYELVIKIYNITKTYPADERYGLISDMRRAANSISNNIAEGFGRYEPKDNTRFNKISRGSAYELLNQTLLSNGLKFINSKVLGENKKEIPEIIDELDLMIKTIETRKR